MKKTLLVIGVAGLFLLNSCGTNSGNNSAQVVEEEVVNSSINPSNSSQNIEIESSSAENSNDSKAKIEVLEDSFNFGTIKEGEKVERSFTLKNIGGAPLIISGASASCGCTTPEFSAQPIPPGQTTTIKTVFDSNGQVGQQHKLIIVASNAENGMVQLHLRGEVKPKN